MRPIALAFSAALSTIVALSAKAQSPMFVVKALAMLPGENSQYVTGINNSGEAVGFVLGSNGVNTAVVWHDAMVTPLVLPAGATNSTALSINNAGQIVGTMVVKIKSGALVGEAVLWNNGIPTVLPPPDAWHSDVMPTHINDSGEITGSASQPGPAVAVVWNGTTPTVLELGGYESAYASASNDSGLVVGSICCGLPDLNQPAVWHGTTATLLPDLTPENATGGAVAVNNSGLVVGYASDEIVGVHAVAWVDKTIISIGPTLTMPNAINDRGIVVGQISTNVVAGIWGSIHSTAIDLNTLISTAAANEIALTDAIGINNNCVIVANGYVKHQSGARAFVLSLADQSNCVNGLGLDSDAGNANTIQSEPQPAANAR